MYPKFERYLHFKRAIQDWLLGQTDVSSIALLLGVRSSSLREMLSWYGLADVSGHPLDSITDQDVMNAIFFSYVGASYRHKTGKQVKR